MAVCTQAGYTTSTVYVFNNLGRSVGDHRPKGFRDNPKEFLQPSNEQPLRSSWGGGAVCERTIGLSPCIGYKAGTREPVHNHILAHLGLVTVEWLD